MLPRLIFWASRLRVFQILQLLRRQDASPRETPPRARQNDAQTQQIVPSHEVTGSKLPRRSSHTLASCLLVQHSRADIRCLPSVRRLRGKNRDFFIFIFYFFAAWGGWGSLKDGGQNFEVCDTDKDVSWLDFPLMCC